MSILSASPRKPFNKNSEIIAFTDAKFLWGISSNAFRLLLHRQRRENGTVRTKGGRASGAVRTKGECFDGIWSACKQSNTLDFPFALSAPDRVLVTGEVPLVKPVRDFDHLNSLILAPIRGLSRPVLDRDLGVSITPRDGKRFINIQRPVRMSTPARKRLMRDFKRLQQDPPAGISGAPQDNNIMLWNAVIFGPDDTPWDGGTFKLTLQFTEDYPNKPPTVRFVSRMFHPNIYADGSICLDILQNQWSPIYDVAAILTSIQSLLCDPNPNSPANSEAARMFSENKREYNRRVREIVEQSWTAD
ncbi:unnamed protein product [Citrullus colocynthis]|uniref:UBC core domain-containing protein n=1 Tax=Citrullus colocynthis TaxID=252529 RepID=A0ABP0Y8D2_9ROSI